MDIDAAVSSVSEPFEGAAAAAVPSVFKPFRMSCADISIDDDDEAPLMILSPPDSASQSETLTTDRPSAEDSSEWPLPDAGRNLTEESSSAQPLLLTYHHQFDDRRRELYSPQNRSFWEDNNRHRSFFYQPPYSRIKPFGVGLGLNNLGLTCFVNAVLQCFTHTVPLVQKLCSWDHANPCDRDLSGFCLMCFLREHIKESLFSSDWDVSPVKLVDNLNKISSSFRRFQQEDAHEFQQAMLDKLEKCCLDQNKDDKSSPTRNIVDEVFGGRLISKLRCCNCGHCSSTHEPLIDLSLEIENAEDLTAALKSFTDVEKMDDPEMKFWCENCKEKVSLEKQLLVEKEPTVAALHLKRFKIDGFSVDKIDKHVPFPLELDLRPFSCESDVDLKYQLYAIVVHTGMSPTWGHYFSFVQSSPGVWHKFDDDKVVKVNEEFVMSQDAYILFYAKEGTPWISSLIEDLAPNSNLISRTSPNSVLDKIDTYGPSAAFHNKESSTSPEPACASSGIPVPDSPIARVQSPSKSNQSFLDCETFTMMDEVRVDKEEPAELMLHNASQCFAMDASKSNQSFLDCETFPLETSGAASLNRCFTMMDEVRVDKEEPTGSRDESSRVGCDFVKGKETVSVSNSDVYDNHRHDDHEMDVTFNILTSSEHSSPESLQVHRGKKSPEARNKPFKKHQQRKMNHLSCKKQLSKPPVNPERREASRILRNMPHGRASQFWNAMHLSPKKKPAKRRMIDARG